MLSSKGRNTFPIWLSLPALLIALPALDGMLLLFGVAIAVGALVASSALLSALLLIERGRQNELAHSSEWQLERKAAWLTGPELPPADLTPMIDWDMFEKKIERIVKDDPWRELNVADVMRTCAVGMYSECAHRNVSITTIVSGKKPIYTCQACEKSFLGEPPSRSIGDQIVASQRVPPNFIGRVGESMHAIGKSAIDVNADIARSMSEANKITLQNLQAAHRKMRKAKAMRDLKRQRLLHSSYYRSPTHNRHIAKKSPTSRSRDYR